jgi:hypothetical protein
MNRWWHEWWPLFGIAVLFAITLLALMYGGQR